MLLDGNFMLYPSYSIQGPHCCPRGHDYNILGELDLCDCTVHIHWREYWGNDSSCAVYSEPPPAICMVFSIITLPLYKFRHVLFMATAELWSTRKAMQHWKIGSRSLGTRIASTFHVHHSSAIAIEYMHATSLAPRAKISEALACCTWNSSNFHRMADLG